MRKLLSVLFVAFLGFATTPQAFAHVEVVNSFPEQFSNVNPIPTQVWIEFSGNLQTLDGQAVNTLEVVDSTGIAVNYEDPIISGGRITTKISGQSAPGAFTVKYRVVGDDGHVIEGEYSFNASPDYAEGQSPMPISAGPEKAEFSIGAIVLAVFLVIFAIGYFINLKKDKR
ncbi:MAG: copper resistance protein CopC [Actinomycetales bacterium]|jgi:methionine-rich copper-binding protein CopC|nr:copper resistance protein CopC [Actinomycetales bacterium]